VLEDFNLTMDAFKEHIIGLLLDQKSIDAYNALPPAIKGNFTKIYNSVFKSSIKAKKVKKISGAADYSFQKNFDAGEDMNPDFDDEDEEEGDEDEVIVEQIKGGSSGPKKGAAPPGRGGAAIGRGGTRGGAAAARGGSAQAKAGVVKAAAPQATTNINKNTSFASKNNSKHK
jgi:hypothetical protein